MQSSTSKFKRRTLLFTAATALFAGTAGFSQAANNWNPEHILAAFRAPFGGAGKSVGVISHRGLVGRGCPENSACSIHNTYDNNIEAIELDVKQSSTGVPWLFHDQNMGRMLSHSPDFDIFQNPTNPKGWNPDLRTMSDQDLTDAFLRDRNFDKTGYHPVSLARAFSIVHDSANHMIVVLDLKTLDAVARASDLAKLYKMENQVVLKFSASLLPGNPEMISTFTKGVPFTPTIYAGDMDRIAENKSYNPECNYKNKHYCSVISWILEARKQPNFAWLEIGNKQPKKGDPTAQLLDDYSFSKKAIGAFSPVPEYRLNVHDGYHYVRSNATCCAALSDYLTKTKYFGKEVQDDRGNFLEQVLMGATNVISDDPLKVIRGVTRHTERYN